MRHIDPHKTPPLIKAAVAFVVLVIAFGLGLALFRGREAIHRPPPAPKLAFQPVADAREYRATHACPASTEAGVLEMVLSREQFRVVGAAKDSEGRRFVLAMRTSDKLRLIMPDDCIADPDNRWWLAPVAMACIFGQVWAVSLFIPPLRRFWDRMRSKF